jgi:hypothetical protein
MLDADGTLTAKALRKALPAEELLSQTQAERFLVKEKKTLRAVNLNQ